jgi:hypothetical protein
LNIVTRLAVGALAVLAVTAPVNTASAAPAAGAAATRTWTTIETLAMAKHQACKVSVNDGATWKIVNRLNSRNVTGGRLRASMTVTHHGNLTQRDWTSGWVHQGDVSAAGAVYIPRQPGYGLQMTISGDNFGDGGLLRPMDIGRCWR